MNIASIAAAGATVCKNNDDTTYAYRSPGSDRARFELASNLPPSRDETGTKGRVLSTVAFHWLQNHEARSVHDGFKVKINKFEIEHIASKSVA